MKPPAEPGGFAVILVLGALLIAAAVAWAALSLAGTQATAGRVTLDRLAVEARVEGAIHRAIIALLDVDSRSRLAERGPDVGDASVSLSVIDVCGRWDLNVGDPAIFGDLVAAVDPRADRHAILDELERARTSGDGFAVVDQIKALPSVTPALSDALMADLTVDCRAAAVDPAFASERLLGATPRDARQRGPRQAFEIRAAAAEGPGTRVEIAAIVAITFEPGRAWRIVSWKPVS